MAKVVHKSARTFERPRKSHVQPDKATRDFIERRVQGFVLDRGEAHPIIHLMMESYMQGMRDTLQAIEHRAIASEPSNG